MAFVNKFCTPRSHSAIERNYSQIMHECKSVVVLFRLYDIYKPPYKMECFGMGDTGSCYLSCKMHSSAFLPLFSMFAIIFFTHFVEAAKDLAFFSPVQQVHRIWKHYGWQNGIQKKTTTTKKKLCKLIKPAISSFISSSFSWNGCGWIHCALLLTKLNYKSY